ncbi:MAG: hypothetical protein EA384_05390 [Spirochaetaceae bacterium]|nr:MAG: hypothetical protein EA384_05390 [Spirochaetaceae bacterium]
MQQTSYIIGAGFSAPLGLPVRASFLERAKDMLFRHPERYAHHHSLIKEFDQIAKVGVYCSTDPLDIEEALAIIEMESFAKARRTKKPFVDLIQDTIEHYSRALEKIEGPVEEEWVSHPFGRHRRINLYGVFVASLLSLRLAQRAHPAGRREAETEFVAERQQPRARYALLTTNYDLVLERFAAAIHEYYHGARETRLMRPVLDEDADDDNGPTVVPLVKLHGSVDGDILLPATWARSTHRKAAQIWERGLALLSQSNHIRIIGHGLGAGDAHMRYLIKAAVLAAPHVKTIDVICLDPDGGVKRRYRSFFTFRNFRFVNADVLSYLKFINDWYARRSSDPNTLSTALLEEAHEEFMTRPGEAHGR